MIRGAFRLVRWGARITVDVLALGRELRDGVKYAKWQAECLATMNPEEDPLETECGGRPCVAEDGQR